MSGLEILGISKSFGEVSVLKEISFEAGGGEFVVLLGPSGCGKTTLLRLIAGLEQPDGGDILLDGRNIVNVQTKDRDVAMVFQNYALYPHMSVADNLSFGLRMRNLDRAEIERRVHSAAGLLGLEALLGRRPRELSGGQKQRVAMGRAMVRKPKLFLFDEPLSNLDAGLRAKMRTEIKRLHQELRISTIYVTHDQIEAMTLASKIVLLHKGAVQQVGTPAELFHKPSNLFVAGFIGTPQMNFLSLGQEDGGSENTVIGIRPDDLFARPTDDEGGWRSFLVDVQVVEPLGSRIQLTSAFKGQELVALVPEALSPCPGDKIELWYDSKKIHAFDKASGARV